MQLSDIKQFLDIYRQRLDIEDKKKDDIQRVLHEETGIFFEQKIIILKNGILEIKTNTIFKNEIFLRKEKLLSRFTEEYKKNTLPIIHTIH